MTGFVRFEDLKSGEHHLNSKDVDFIDVTNVDGKVKITGWKQEENNKVIKFIADDMKPNDRIESYIKTHKSYGDDKGIFKIYAGGLGFVVGLGAIITAKSNKFSIASGIMSLVAGFVCSYKGNKEIWDSAFQSHEEKAAAALEKLTTTPWQRFWNHI